MRIEHGIEIAAPVARVWKLTLDVEAWPDFTPTMTRVEWLGPPPVGIGSRARIKQPAQRAKIRTVTVFEPECRFVRATKSMGLTMIGTHHLAASEAGNDQHALDRPRGSARARGGDALPAADPEGARNGERRLQVRCRARRSVIAYSIGASTSP